MYPWDKVDPETDSTIRLIHECVSRKYTVALATVNNLTMRESTGMAFCNVFLKDDTVSQKITTFYKMPVSGKSNYH